MMVCRFEEEIMVVTKPKANIFYADLQICLSLWPVKLAEHVSLLIL
jgi:hypothetical protein